MVASPRRALRREQGPLPTSHEVQSAQAREALPFRSEEVQLGAPPFVLGGTLTLPPGEGPFPGAVLLAGSGPQDRDGTLGPNKPLRDIAEGLTLGGIAVLRYDKRTLAHGPRSMRAR